MNFPTLSGAHDATLNLDLPPEGPLPYWLVNGPPWEQWPLGLRAAYNAIFAPAYQELVVRAAEGLVQLTGVSVSYMLWLELLDQLQLGSGFAEGTPLQFLAGAERVKAIKRHLRLISAKLKYSDFLQRLREFRVKYGTLL